MNSGLDSVRRAWLRDLERSIGGPWWRELSLAIDRVVVLLESP